MNFIVYDLEATCWPNRPSSLRQEIIEIGAFKLSGTGEVKDEFSAFVRPIVHPMLSPFCKELTNITQPQVNSAYKWDVVHEDFLDFIGYYDDEEYLLCAWGNWDAKQLAKDCLLHDLDDEWTTPNIDCKAQYARIKRLKRPYGLAKSLRLEGYEWQGEQHRALADARNLANLFLEYIDEWAY